MHLLIVSPIASEPRTQGNSARIARLGMLLQSAGFIVHFLYHQMEGLSLVQEDAMRSCWDHLHLMPGPVRRLSSAQQGPYGLDDWSDPNLVHFTRELSRCWHFSVVIANYIWCSAILEVFKSPTVRVLDTHDVFSGREQVFKAAGLNPHWFFTTPAEEARGLARCDIVLAVQDKERAAFTALGHGDVRTVGHLLAQAPGGFRSSISSAQPLVVGYLASGNPLNVAAFDDLLAALVTSRATGRRRGWRELHWVVAGSISSRLTTNPMVEIRGEVSSTADFYDSVDITINPMSGGTGLKIKSVEAVFAGMPLIATRDAMEGLSPDHALHQLETVNDVVQAAYSTVWTMSTLRKLQKASEQCASKYSAITQRSLARLLRDLGADEVRIGRLLPEGS